MVGGVLTIHLQEPVPPYPAQPSRRASTPGVSTLIVKAFHIPYWACCILMLFYSRNEPTATVRKMSLVKIYNNYYDIIYQLWCTFLPLDSTSIRVLDVLTHVISHWVRYIFPRWL